MNIKFKKYLILYGVLQSFLSYAASDPVSWQLTPSTNPLTIPAGGQASAVYTLTNHLPIPVLMSTIIKSTGAPITYQDECNQKKLAPSNSCNVTVFFNPRAAGKSSFQLSYKYNDNEIPLPEWTAIASQSTYNLTGEIEGLPSFIYYPGLVQQFNIDYTNNGTNGLSHCFLGDAAGNNQLFLDSSSIGQGQLQILSSNCGTVNAPISLSTQPSGKSHCLVNAQFTPSHLGAITIGSLMTCSETTSSPSSDATVVSSSPALTGTFSTPKPFPSKFYTNQAPYVAAQFRNTGNVPLTNCKAENPTELSINPSSAATITVDSPIPSTCGTQTTPITLNPGAAPCTIYGKLSSLQSTNNATLTAQMTCDQTAASVQKSFAIETQSGSCSTATVTATLPLPTSTYKYANNMVTFQVTNICATDRINLGTVDITATSGAATITGTAANPPATYDQCSSQTLSPGDRCNITASVIPSDLAPLTVTASVPVNGGAPVTGSTTATTVKSNQQTAHHVVFVNQCPFDVWYGVANGNGSSCPGTACKSPDPNLKDNPNGAIPDAYHLAEQTPNSPPATIDLEVVSYQNGAFWPRTGCSMQNGQFNCATGTCQTMPNSATCLSPSGGGTGPVQPQSPFTKFEATIVETAGGDGVYDVSVINGMTVPVEVKAFGPSTGNTANTVYNCSSAGAILQPETNNALGNCSWDFNPESTMLIPSINSDFYWVTPGADDACTNGLNCGMSYSQYPQPNGNSPGPVNRRQGGFLGFNPLVNDAAYIATAQWGSRNLFSLYGMGKQIPRQYIGNNYGTTLVDGTSIVLPGNTYPAYNVLLSIPGISNNGSLNSCYQIGNTFFEHCGGCIDWNITLPSEDCGNGSPNYKPNWNLDWTSNKISATVGSYTPLQAIAWLKQACPTAYSYQFDDPSSSFQCTQDGTTLLKTSYQVTFCPGGVTGLPEGATEGRSTPP